MALELRAFDWKDARSPLSVPAFGFLEQAARRLGYLGIFEASVDGGLPDAVSEAIEAAEDEQGVDRSCSEHGSQEVCDAEELDTDAQGFVHRQQAGGKLPLKRCFFCARLRAKAGWSEDFFLCSDCGTRPEHSTLNVRTTKAVLDSLAPKSKRARTSRRAP